MRIAVVVNTRAGRQTILHEIDEIQGGWEAAGHDVTTLLTGSVDQADRIIGRSLGDEPDLLVCCGGDGTLSEAVSCILQNESKTPLGYIPAGTTNDFAVSLGLPREPQKAAEIVLERKPRPLDVGRFGDRSFVYVASFGAFTQSSYSTDQNMKKNLGHLAYLLEGIKELPVIKPCVVRVETAEGESFRGEYIFGALGNSTSFGGVVRMDPAQVDQSDGLFELVLVKMPKSLMEWNRVVHSFMSGKYDDELIQFTHTRGASFRCSEPFPWSLDGEYAPGGELVEAEVLPGAVQLVY